MPIKPTLLIVVGLAFLAGCSGDKDLPVAGKGGTPPPFKARMEAGMAKRNAAMGNQAAPPTAGGATATK